MATRIRPKRGVQAIGAGLFVLLLLTACTTNKTPAKQNDSTSQEESTPQATTQTDTDPTAGLTEDDLSTLQLNFPESYVVIKGYSFLARNVLPNLYHLVYLGTTGNNSALLSDSSVPESSYFADMAAGQIVFPVGNSPAGIPITHTLKVLPATEFEEQTAACTLADYDLRHFEAQTVACPESESTLACAVQLADGEALYYQQKTTDTAAEANLCDTLAAHYIASIELKPY